MRYFTFFSYYVFEIPGVFYTYYASQLRSGLAISQVSQVAAKGTMEVAPLTEQAHKSQSKNVL